MSYYAAISSDIRLRNVDNVVLFQDKNFCLFKEKNMSIIYPNIKSKNLAHLIFDYIIQSGFQNVEIDTSSLHEKDVTELAKKLYEYLLDNELSVGLLFKNKRYVHRYSKLFSELGIVSIGIEEIFNRDVYGMVRFKEAMRLERMAAECCIQEDALSSPRNLISIKETFQDKLIDYLNASGKTNSEIYNAGQISRQVFSKIISTTNYIPKKDTVICLIIGMELNYSCAIDLLNAAGYALSKNILFDTIVDSYLKDEIFDINEINETLNENNCPLLGRKPRDN